MKKLDYRYLVGTHERTLVHVEQNEFFVSTSRGAGTAAFLVEMANNRLRIAQTSAFLGKSFADKGAGLSLSREPRTQLLSALSEFCTALERDYVSDANEILSYFSCALANKDWAAAHFLTALPTETWWDGENQFRWQAFFGFSILRAETERIKRVLDYLEGLCFDDDAGKDQSPQAEFQRVTWRALNAIYRRDIVAFSTHLAQRLDLWEATLTREQSNDCLYLYDLAALGFIRLAQMCGMSAGVSHGNLPLALLARADR